MEKKENDKDLAQNSSQQAIISQHRGRRCKLTVSAQSLLSVSQNDMKSFEDYWSPGCKSEGRKRGARQGDNPKATELQAPQQRQDKQVSSRVLERKQTQELCITGRHTKAIKNKAFDKTHVEVVDFQNCYAESEGQNDKPVHTVKSVNRRGSIDMDNLASTLTKANTEPSEPCKAGKLSLNDVETSGIQSAKSSKNSKKTVGQNKAKHTPSEELTSLRRSKRIKSLSHTQQISDSDCVPFASAEQRVLDQASVKRLSPANKRSTKPPHNHRGFIQNEPKSRNGTLLLATHAENQGFHDSQAASCALVVSNSTCRREAQQSPPEVAKLSDSDKDVDDYDGDIFEDGVHNGHQDGDEGDKDNGYEEVNVDVQYPSACDSDEENFLSTNPNTVRNCVDKKSCVTKSGRLLGHSKTVMSINGEATGSWTKVVPSDDYTLVDPLKSLNTRKRLSYSAGPSPWLDETLQDTGNCSDDTEQDTEQASESEELIDVGVESLLVHLQKGKSDGVVTENRSFKQTKRKNSGKAVAMRRKAKSVEKSGKDIAQASEEKQDDVQTQSKGQKVSRLRANQLFDLAEISAHSEIPGTVSENSKREGEMILETEQGKNSLKVKRKRGRPRKVPITELHSEEQCLSPTDSDPAFVSLSHPDVPTLEKIPEKHVGVQLRSQTGRSTNSKKDNQATKGTVMETTLSGNYVVSENKSASQGTDEVHRQRNLELVEENDDRFVLSASYCQNSVKTPQKIASKTRNSSESRPVVCPHSASCDSPGVGVDQLEGIDQKGPACVVVSQTEQQTQGKALPKGRRKRTTSPNSVCAGKVKRSPKLVVSKLPSLPFQRLLEGGDVQMAEVTSEERVPPARTSKKSRKKVPKKKSTQLSDTSVYVTPVREPSSLNVTDFDQVNEYETNGPKFSAIAGSFSGPIIRSKRRKLAEMEGDANEASAAERSHNKNALGKDDQVKNKDGEETLEDEDVTRPIPSPSLHTTPQKQKPANGIRKKRQRRVTINSVILPSPQHYSQPLATPSTVRKSILKTPGTNSKSKSYLETPQTNSGSMTCLGTPGTNNNSKSYLETPGSEAPVHYWEMTKSETLVVDFDAPAVQNSKIILPEPAPGGLRRSQRTRLKPLAWYENERAVYDKRKSGGFLIVNVAQPAVNPMKEKTNKLKRKVQQIKRQQAMELKERRLSVHVSLPEKVKFASGGNIMVRNPEAPNTEMLAECVGTQQFAQYWGPTRQQDQASDPYVLCKYFQEKAFSVGELVIRPMEEKPTQTVSDSTMIFSILEGKLAVTIHETTSILQKRDVFYIPPENTYSLKNLRKTSAKLFFTQVRGNTT